MKKGILFLLFTFLALSSSAQYSVSGKITNQSGEAIEFASVFLEQTTYASVTGAEGNYTLDDIEPGIYSLKCTYLGYESVVKEITISDSSLEIDIVMTGSIYQLDRIEIISNRVTENDPITYSNIDKEELSRWNNGQDMPYLLRFTPSIVVTSDAGNGIGYTGVRLRGSDATRVNVTINGIPLNDAESQGVFWVNMPDFGSSVENIQIQRGVGTSTSGVGSFGGTISLNTKMTHLNPYASVSAGYGSFDSKRFNVKLGTGLLNDKYSIDVRYSSIRSDGYIDRASSNLSSLFFGASRIDETSSTRIQIFTGSEKTYQAWYGVPEARIQGNESDLLTHYYNNKGVIYETIRDSVNLFTSDRRYNYYLYENQVDDYGQTHVQLHDHRKLSEYLVLNSALNFTHGSGFFEEYKNNENLSDYGISEQGQYDLIRRRWLDNIFYGGNFNVHYDDREKLTFTFGVSAFQYDGDHFGRVIDIPALQNFLPGQNYYFNVGKKSDLSTFFKFNYEIYNNVSIFSDFQVRHIDYTINGDDNDGQQLNVQTDYSFFNPKAGISVTLSDQSYFYSSFAIGNKEPNRSDFTDHPVSTRPLPERLYDLEIGYEYRSPGFFGEIVFYNMQYKDQLVLTGALNDVGSPLRINVPNSFRRGVELNVNTEIDQIRLGMLATLSSNKIESFDEVIYDYTNGFETIVINHENTDIAFSPSGILTGKIGYQFSDNFSLDLMNQFVSRQYLDNTSSPGRSMDGYLRGDLLIQWNPELSFTKNISIKGEVRNIWNNSYVSNGYTYSYIFGESITENFYYPQANRNFMLTTVIEFGK